MKSQVKKWKVKKSLYKDYKLSELLRIALSDLVAVQRDDIKYRIDMGTWYSTFLIKKNETEDIRVCEVCLAGSLLVKTFSLPTDDYEGIPDGLGDELWYLLRAVNYLRTGHILQAHNLLNKYRGLRGYKTRAFATHDTEDDYQKSLQDAICGTNEIFTQYDADREEFFEQMERMVKVLKCEGL